MTFRFVIDENIPSSVSSWLIGEGFDTKSTVDALRRGATDAAIARYARDEGRIVISLDQDFIRLHRQLKIRFGVIVVRAHPPTPSRVQECLERLFSKADIEKHQNTLIVVTEREIRIETI